MLLGYVFSPYYVRARKASRSVDPLEHAAVNVALYGPRGHLGWVLTERDRGFVHRSPSGLSIGPSRIGWEGDVLALRFDERTPLLGKRMAGVIRIIPEQFFNKPVVLDDAGLHHWCGIAPLARCEVEMEQPDLRFSGSGYHDTNWGDEPLENGFHYWNWSRAELNGRAAVLYDVVTKSGQSRNFGILFNKDGTTGTIDPPRAVQLKRTGWRIDRATRTDADGDARVTRTLEDTPFYARTVLQTRLQGQNVPAVHETLDMDRFQTGAVQWMLAYRMKRIPSK
jgi:carotenoid 1,2-hydratase